ncbi:oxygen-dependent tRNA uridine(34) hydroxylase TrhO [Yunchengibacter salinarum]|uniref:oxygen-dependent tRNA uridine(34) hydroxylase TrhO n=1 Tax=Yunchengibacter salinarum TaxID=3133399 RepID=UPI0035B5AF88
MTETLIATLYHFAPVPDPASLRETLEADARRAGLKGTLLVAREGLNGTLAGAPDALRGFVRGLRDLQGFDRLTWKESLHAVPPFHRLKVRLKREIVTMGVPEIDPERYRGHYVAPRDWNDLIQRDDVMLVDTRNDYEVAIGSFEGAIDPGTHCFRDLPEWLAEHADPARTPKVAMFCTGGIRCEKSTAYLRQKGFEDVYHLEGGILNYLERVPEEESLWRGACFVFDERVAVGHDLAPTGHVLCRGCRRPVDADARQDPRFEPGVSCPACHDGLSDAAKARRRERWRQVKLAEARGEQHIGQPMGQSTGEDGGSA